MQTDNKIKTDVLAQLEWDDSIRDSEIEVVVDRGKVILNGHVNSAVVRDSASKDVYAVDGVIDVDNQLHVHHPDEKRIPSNDELHEALKNAFRSIHNIDGTKIEITVDNGMVTLKGTVDAFWKKKIVERNAKNVFGVIEVNEELSVVPTKNIIDEDIARAIQDAMERDRHIRGDDIDVSVQDGRVTLSGEVVSQQVKSTLETLVHYTSGVQELENNVMVKYPEEV